MWTAGQAHYLSHDARTSFIKACSEQVTERRVVAVNMLRVESRCNPQCIANEKTTLVLRYVMKEDQTSQSKVCERFVTFHDCNERRGQIAEGSQ